MPPFLSVRDDLPLSPFEEKQGPPRSSIAAGQFTRRRQALAPTGWLCGTGAAAAPDMAPNTLETRDRKYLISRPVGELGVAASLLLLAGVGIYSTNGMAAEKTVGG